ncbi:MAG TPA: hypothetical protein VE032_05900 [Actinomycetota bacterium]|nr:hypothetical protein [Actinomycetota bacterium]
MTTIRTTCPRCGEVDMGPESIYLSVAGNGNEGSYRFTCPSCADDVEKRADRKIVALLVSAGVDIDERDGGQTSLASTHPELFDELGEELRDLGPAFTTDDVIEFHYLLEDEAYIRDFLASSGGY